MNSFFSKFGGKTKFFGTIMVVAGALETSGVLPAGTVEAVNQLFIALGLLGTIFGVADKLDRLVK